MALARIKHTFFMKGFNERARYYLVLAVIGCLYLELAWNTSPTLTDDLIYEFKFNLANDYSHPQHIDSLGDIFESMAAHYFTTNGRLPVHFVAQLFLSFVPKHVLDVVNALMFVALLRLSMLFLGIRAGRVSSSVLMASIMFLAMIGFQSAMLWSCGTFNNLWVLVVTLSFILLFCRYGNRPLRWWHWLLSLPVVLVGWSHEGLSIPVSAALLFFAISHRHSVFKQLAFPLMFFYAVGTALCLSPAILSRAAGDTSIVHRLMSGCVVLALQSRVLWLLVVVAVVTWYRNKAFVMEWISRNRYLLVACAVAYCIAFLCGDANVRVNFFGEFMALLLLADMLCGYSLGIRRIVADVLSFIAFIVLLPAVYCLKMQMDDYEYAVRQMETPGKTVIRTHITRPEGWFSNLVYDTYVVPFASFHYYQCYMGFDASDSNMRCAAVKYGKPSMIFLPDKIVDKIENGTLSSTSFTFDAADNLYAIKLNDNRQVHKVTFKLKKEDVGSLRIWQRPLAYKGDTFELDDFHWQVVTVGGSRVLVLTKPLTNVFRRVQSIEIG